MAKQCNLTRSHKWRYHNDMAQRLDWMRGGLVEQTATTAAAAPPKKKKKKKQKKKHNTLPRSTYLRF